MKNDQGHIIKALKENNYIYVWEQVKYIGYKIVPDPSTRMAIFYKVVDIFNPEINNNFIHFYKKHLKYLNPDRYETYRTSDNLRMIIDVNKESISPTDTSRRYVLNELKKWNN